MSASDIRWMQRCNHYKKALSQLREAVHLSQERPLSKLEERGLIQAFEVTHELAWNTLKDFLESRGVHRSWIRQAHHEPTRPPVCVRTRTGRRGNPTRSVVARHSRGNLFSRDSSVPSE